MTDARYKSKDKRYSKVNTTSTSLLLVLVELVGIDMV